MAWIRSDIDASKTTTTIDNRVVNDNRVSAGEGAIVATAGATVNQTDHGAVAAALKAGDNYTRLTTETLLTGQRMSLGFARDLSQLAIGTVEDSQKANASLFEKSLSAIARSSQATTDFAREQAHLTRGALAEAATPDAAQNRNILILVGVLGVAFMGAMALGR